MPTAAVLVAQSSESPTAEEWTLPDPDLTGLEPAVAKQLERVRQEIVERQTTEPVSLQSLAETVGVLGQHYHSYQLIEPARECYRLAQLWSPTDFRWPYLQGFLAQTNGELETAQSLLQDALLLDNSVSPAWVRLGEVLERRGEYPRAEHAFRRSIAINDTSAAGFAGLGRILVAQENFAGAAGALERALQLAPQANQLYYPLAQVYRGAGQLQRAQQALAKSGSIGVRPDDPLLDGLEELKTGERAFLLVGHMAFAAGDYAAAAEAFARAAGAAPESVRARINLAASLAPLGQPEKAIEVLRQALSLAPDNPTALFNLALLLIEQGDLSSASMQLRAVLRITPDDDLAARKLAQTSYRLGDLESALQAYQRVLRLTPNDTDAHLGKAQVLLDMGRYQEAQLVLLEANRMYPDSGLVTHALARFLAAAPVTEMRDGVRALQLAQRVYESNPTWRHGETVALALAELDRCQEAVHWIEELLKLESIPADQTAMLLATQEHFAAGPPCRWMTSPPSSDRDG